ncbi:uncharacterized protein LOC114331857 isoform X2 [Diabrotica virgifera virgifera]|uniref:Uncharacterized protein n=1 Tax=Diabrotica virgifera virgifera TaxID=50390 RepID=A0ABM5JLW2_DIAVI|nr:uncharacterized protein LOC114331857 isoform X2 [Diabrotica virgifera virgifera]
MKMLIKVSDLLILCCVLLLIACIHDSDAKRGGGSRGGGSRSKSTSGGSSWWWSSNKKSSSSSSKTPSLATGAHAPAPAPKAPAPHYNTIKKQTSHVSHQPASNPHYGNNQQNPIGWNVPGNKQAPKAPASQHDTIKKQTSHVSHQPASNPHHGNKQQNAMGWNIPGNKQAPKASAPQHDTIKKQTSHVSHQQPASSPHYGNNQQNPNGWNVQGNKQAGHHQTHSYPTGNQPHGSWPNSGQYPHQHGSWGTQHGSYGNQHGGWGNQQHGGWGGQQQSGWGGQHGGWGGQHGGYGGQNYGGWGNGYSNPGYSGYGGMQRGGFMGGGYGGGMGGYGMGMGMGMGMGGMGGYGGYGMQRKSGFFSGGSTFGNILTGMAIYHVTSSLVKGIFGVGQKRPYNVYNYYNQPPEAREEIKLPSNLLTMCEGNLTTVCTGATAICTTNNTVLCVVTMSQAAPCADEKAMCINTTIPCADKSDPLCQNTTQQQTETTVNLPCYTNLSVDINLLNEPGAAKTGDDYQYCVTTMAVAGPEYSKCSDESILEKFNYRNILAGNYIWNLTVIPMMRKYQSYNYDNPTQTPSGELNLPLTALIPCIDNATVVCAPELVTICTGFGEVMCIKPLTATTYCEQYNTTCQTSQIECQENIEQDILCQNKTEEELVIKEEKKFVNVEMPCFANVTLNTNLPNFDITTFNGTIPASAPSSFMYHYHFCLITLSIPGPETDMCLIGDGN